MSPWSKRLAELNAQAEEMQCTPKEIPWEKGVSHRQFWIPETLTHLFHLPIYQRFSLEEKLSYNHAFAIMVLEQSILFEAQLCSFIKKSFPHAQDLFGVTLDHFLREEKEHTEMFWRLIQLSDPDAPGRRRYRYYRPKILDWISAKVLLNFPRVAILWTWLSLYGEEKFLLNFREIKRASAHPANLIDSLHEAVHYYHMVDESRHVQVDEVFIQKCWDQAPRWLRRVNRVLLAKIFRSFVVRSNSGLSLWKAVLKKHPEMDRHSRKVRLQLKTLGQIESYQKIVSARSSIPRISGLFDQRSEFRSFSKVLPFYSPRSSSCSDSSK